MTADTYNSNTPSSTIHILHIASGDLWAGAEVMLYTLAKASLAVPGVQVSAVILNHGELEKRLRGAGAMVQVLDESRLNSFQIYQQLRQIIAEIDPDIIHTHRNKENFLGGLAASLTSGKPSLRTAHGAPEHRPPLYQPAKHLIRFMDWFSGRYLQRYIVAVSDDLATKLGRSYPQSKIKVIENGIDIDAITARLSSVENQADKSNWRIGIAGRLVPVKRVDLFIDMAVYIKQHHEDLAIDFVIYGDGPLMETLRSQVEAYNATSYIRFTGHCEDITSALQALDVLLMTSDHEGLPMILLEAMCTRTPIIAHAVGGIPELFQSGKCGTLVEHHTAEAFAEATMRLIGRPELIEETTGRALERVKEKYSAELTANAYIELYRQVINHDRQK